MSQVLVLWVVDGRLWIMGSNLPVVDETLAHCFAVGACKYGQRTQFIHLRCQLVGLIGRAYNTDFKIGKKKRKKWSAVVSQQSLH